MNLFNKYYSLAKDKNFLFESIYSNKAMVYHRTNKKELIDNIFEQGFIPNKGFDPSRRNSYSDLYGVGFYACYEAESQFNSNNFMQYQFGPIVVKFIINSLNNFLFVDYQEFIKNELSKKIKWNPQTYIQDQMKYYDFDKIIPLEKLNLKFPYDELFSSRFVRDLVKQYGLTINKLIDGIVFTDSSQGKVLVSYNTNIIIPVSFTDDEGKTWNKIKKDRKYLEKVFSQNVDKKNKNVDKLKKDHWIYKAHISEDASFEINLTNNEVIWYSGTWHDGTWEGGTWKDGTWEKGTWKNGTFEKGDWEFGDWEKGDFLKEAVWWNGTWRDGGWEGGTWHDGTWKDGTWLGGTWLGGIWERGYNKRGKLRPKGYSPDKWNLPITSGFIDNAKISSDAIYKYTDIEQALWEDGTWYDGTWKDGTWKGGTWKGGTWEKGTWKDGIWLGGTWLGGLDKNGRYHSKNDSPDKWKL